MPTRRDALVISAMALLSWMPPLAKAGSGDAMNARPGGLAVLGYDVVAYFTVGYPMVGDPAFELEWRGVRWRFANAVHRDAFAAQPERYAPRYGGFCAGGMALGRRAPIDPRAFVIHDGKLYLHFNNDSAEEMLDDPERVVEKADDNWGHLRQTD